mmetsp:Transcript_10038/g.22038  ORF Transcript_10038/g.22038 Transcript_10038/m.22038 type:complete len:547 (-) Transcript_10038:145-1785(-)
MLSLAVFMCAVLPAGVVGSPKYGAFPQPRKPPLLRTGGPSWVAWLQCVLQLEPRTVFHLMYLDAGRRDRRRPVRGALGLSAKDAALFRRPRHRSGCQPSAFSCVGAPRSRASVAGEEGGRRVLIRGAPHLAGCHKKRRGLLQGGVRVAGGREANPVVGAVVGGVVLAEEGIAEDEERAVRRRHVERHQGHLAAVRALVDVVVGLEVQDLLAHDEAQRGQLVEVRAVRLHVQAARELVDHVRGARELRGARVDGHLAVLAQALLLVVDRDVGNLDLPVAGRAGHGLPEHVRGHMVLLDVAERDLRVLGLRVGEEDGEDRLLQGLALHQVVHDAELRALGHLGQGQTQHSVEVEGREGVVRLVRGAHEADAGAEAADADVVLHEDAADLAGAEGDGHDVAVAALVDRFVGAVGEGHVDSARGERGVEALVRLAGLVRALLGGEEQVAAARVEDDDEVLRRIADGDLAVVLAGVRRLAGRLTAGAPTGGRARAAQAQRGLRSRLHEGGGPVPHQRHRVRSRGGRVVRGRGGEHVADRSLAGQRKTQGPA